ncbi:MAG: VWA domain-containing protein [Lachnospiraceae bacterium]|nr:VWA domain-containing protein [Lachnospiraceae bacterium]
MVIDVLNPYAFLLIPLFAVFFFLTGRRLKFQDKRKKWEYIIVRILVVTLLASSLAQIQVKRVSKDMTTIFVVDMSDSLKDKQDEMETYLKNLIANMPNGNEYGMVAFGKDATVEQFVTSNKNFISLNTDVVAHATNMEDAVATAISMLPEDGGKRIVLISDGLQNEGDIQNLKGNLLANNIEFDWTLIQSDIDKEVYVSDLSVPNQIQIGDTFYVTVSIYSTKKTNATIYLYSGSDIKGSKEVNLQKGENQFVFSDTAVDSGIASYKVRIDTEDDTLALNNEYVTFAQVTDKAKVLLVEGSAGQSEQFQDVLKSANVDFTVCTPEFVPNTLQELNKYKEVIFLDVYADDLREGFMDILEPYVKDYAGGFICIGGSNSYVLGNYRDTAIERVLPVDMDLTNEREVPKMAMVMVIDHSGSMQDSLGGAFSALDLAKSAAVKAVDNLRTTDDVGVLIFDDKYQWVYELASAADKETVKNKIGTVTIGGGTSIYPAINQAVQSLENSDATYKHIVLLTDGQDGYRQYQTLIEKIKDNNITLSTVAVGSGADTGMLQSLANVCGGRYYYTDLNNDMPRIFAQEVFLSTKSYLINETFMPVLSANHKIMENVFTNGVRALNGYVATSAKSTATVILKSHKGDPILAAWQYGLGKSVAFTSDGEFNWTKNYADFDDYVTLWKNITDFCITETDLGEDSITLNQGTDYVEVEYTTKEIDKDVSISMVYQTAENETKEVELLPVEPGKYKGTMDISDIGIYSVNIRKNKEEEVVNNVNTAVAVQYSKEYRLDQTNEALKTMVTELSGNIYGLEDEIFLEPKEVVKSWKDYKDLFLLLALLLYMIDILIRRFNVTIFGSIADAVLRNKKGKKVKAKEEKKVSVNVTQAETKQPKTEETKTVKEKKKEETPKPKKEKKKKEKEEVQALDTAALIKNLRDKK